MSHNIGLDPNEPARSRTLGHVVVMGVVRVVMVMMAIGALVMARFATPANSAHTPILRRKCSRLRRGYSIIFDVVFLTRSISRGHGQS
jgi:hypothetical protein